MLLALSTSGSPASQNMRCQSRESYFKSCNCSPCCYGSSRRTFLAMQLRCVQSAFDCLSCLTSRLASSPTRNVKVCRSSKTRLCLCPSCGHLITRASMEMVTGVSICSAKARSTHEDMSCCSRDMQCWTKQHLGIMNSSLRTCRCT